MIHYISIILMRNKYHSQHYPKIQLLFSYLEAISLVSQYSYLRSSHLHV